MEDAWIKRISMNEEFATAHAHQFIDHLHPNMEDYIISKLLTSGAYSVVLAYKA
jgi:dipeptidase